MSQKPEDQLVKVNGYATPLNMQDSSPILDLIIKLLTESQIEYELLEHGPVHTSQDAARERGTNIKQGAKAIIFAADMNPIVIVVPGDKKIDLKAFKKIYGIKDLRILKPEQVLELTGLEIGAIPPLGNVMNLPTYLDQMVLDNEYILFNAGAHTKSIKMRPQDYVKVVNPKINSFSKPN